MQQTQTEVCVYPDAEEGGWVVTDGTTGDIVSTDWLGRTLRFASRADAEAWVAGHPNMRLAN